MSMAATDRTSSDAVTKIVAQVAAMGANFNETILNQTRAIYTPLVKQQTTGGVTVAADVAFGSDARQKLDVYRPQQGLRLPVLIYIPGGGFVGGDKNFDGVFYGNLGTYFAKHGYLTVVANYRLAPANPWPAGPQDVGGAIAWAKANAAQYGGDPNRVVLWGQSAGATHSAQYLFDTQFHPASGVGVVAGILMSGPYKFAGQLMPNLLSYLGSDPSTYEARSPITHVNNSKVPLMLSVAEFDPGFLATPTFDLASAVTKRDGKAPQIAFMRGHNHVSTVQSIGSVQDDVGAKVREFLAGY